MPTWYEKLAPVYSSFQWLSHTVWFWAMDKTWITKQTKSKSHVCISCKNHCLYHQDLCPQHCQLSTCTWCHKTQLTLLFNIATDLRMMSWRNQLTSMRPRCLWGSRQMIIMGTGLFKAKVQSLLWTTKVVRIISGIYCRMSWKPAYSSSNSTLVPFTKGPLNLTMVTMQTSLLQ